MTLAMFELRRQRNAHLASCDWVMFEDSPVSDATKKLEWQNYRQALRDITTQTPSLDADGNLTGIIWPTPPES